MVVFGFLHTNTRYPLHETVPFLLLEKRSDMSFIGPPQTCPPWVGGVRNNLAQPVSFLPISFPHSARAIKVVKSWLAVIPFTQSLFHSQPLHGLFLRL